MQFNFKDYKKFCHDLHLKPYLFKNLIKFKNI